MDSEIIKMFLEDIEEKISEKKIEGLYEITDVLEFKIRKNKYHLENIKEKTKINIEDEDLNIYYDVLNPLYFEFESLLVNLRTSVDIMLRMANFLYDMELKTNEVTLYNVFHNKKLPTSLKRTFERFTRPYDNPNWNFIYTSRNEIVHHTSIDKIMPINLEMDLGEEVTAFFDLEGKPKDMIVFLSSVIRFLDIFVGEYLKAIKVSYNN